MALGASLIGITNFFAVLWAEFHGGEHAILGAYPAGITMALPTAVAVVLLSAAILIGTLKITPKTEYRKDNE